MAIAVASSVVVLGLALPATGKAAGPCTITWVGDVPGEATSWSANSGGNTNWNDNTLPDAADTACLPAAGSPYDVIALGNITVNELTLGANARLTVNSNFVRALNEVVNGGRITIDGTSGTATLAAGDGNSADAETIVNTGTIELSGAVNGNQRFLSGDISNQGQIVVKDDDAELDESGFDGDRDQTVTNAAGGTITIETGANLGVNNKLVQAGTIANAGALDVFDEGGDANAGLTVNGGSITGSGPNTLYHVTDLAFGGGAASGKLATEGSVFLAVTGSIPSGIEITVRGSLRSTTSFANAGKVTIDGTTGNAHLAAGNGDNANAETVTNTGTIEFGGTENGNHRFLSGDVSNQGNINVKVANAQFDEEGFDGDRDQIVTNTASGTITVDSTKALAINNKLVQAGSIVNNGSIDVFDESGDPAAGLTVNGGSITGTGSNVLYNVTDLAFGASAGSATGKLRTEGFVSLAGNIPAGFEITVRDRLRASANMTNAGKVIVDGTNSNAAFAAGNGDNANAETIVNTGTIEMAGTANGNQRFLSGDVTNQGQIVVKVANGQFDEEGHDADRDQTVTNTATGTITIDNGASLAVNNKLVQAGSIVNNGSIDVFDESGDPSSGLTVNGGSITGSGANTVYNVSDLAFGGGAASGKVTTHFGTVFLTGSIPSGFEIRVLEILRASAGFTNAGKVILDGTSGSPRFGAGNGDNANAETVTNTGTIEFVNNASNVHTLSGDVTNQGQINVKVANSQLDEEGFDNDRDQIVTNTASGTITIDNGAGLGVNSKLVQAGAIVNSGTLSVFDESGDSAAALTVNSGSITGTGDNVLNNVTDLAFGGSSGAATGKLRTEGYVEITGNIPAGFEVTVRERLRGLADLTNAGKVIVDGTNSNATFGTGDGNAGDVETLTNTGTIEFAGAVNGNTRILSGDVINQGQLVVKDDGAQLDEEGFDSDRDQTVTNGSTGTISIESGMALAVNNKLVTTGTIANGGGLNVFDESGDANSELVVNGGQLTGSAASIGNNGTLRLGGDASGAAVLHLAGFEGTVPEDFAVTIYGTAYSGASMVNNGMIKQGDADGSEYKMTDGNGSTAEGLTNNGTWTIEGSGVDSFSGDLVNNGTLTVKATTPANDNNFLTDVGESRMKTVTNNGLISVEAGSYLEGHRFAYNPIVNTGTIAIAPTAAFAPRGGFVQTAGTTTVPSEAALLADDGGPLIDIQGGTLTAGGTVGQDLRNAATVVVGSSPGNLKVDDDYVQTAAGRLVLEVGGPTAVTQFDRVQVDDVATLAGTIEVDGANGFIPFHGQVFEAFTTASGISGAFTARDSDRVDQYEYFPVKAGNRVNLEARDVQDPETTITGGPEGNTDDRTPTFTFSANEGSTFECRIDGGDFTPCSGPGNSHTPATELADGDHIFAVWAVDVADNVDRTSARRQFSIGASGGTGGGSSDGETSESGREVDGVPPVLRLGKVKGLKKPKKGAVGKVLVSCSEACTVSALGDLVGARGKGMSFKGTSARLSAGASVTLRVKMTAAGAKQARKAMRSGRSVSAIVFVSATDASRNTSVARKLVKMKGGSKKKSKKGRGKR